MKKQKFLALIIICLAIFALVLPASAQAPEGWEGWYQNDDRSWSYYENGNLCVDYWLYDNGDIYYLDENGIMPASEWRVIGDEEYYFGANGAAYTDGIYKIGNYYYGFNESGCLYTNTEFSFEGWDGNDSYFNYTYRAKEYGKLYQNEWYEEDGSWYYYGNDCCLVNNEVVKIGGDYYGFDWEGRMYSDSLFEIYVEGEGENDWYYARANGKLYVDGWYQADGEHWFCFAADGRLYRDDVYKIGDYYYGFDSEGRMYDDGAFGYWRYNAEMEDWYLDSWYRAKKGGRLYVNEWYYDEEFGNEWYYYGAGGKAATGPLTIGGKLYVFGGDGYMYSNRSVEIETASGTKWYVVDENGIATELFNNQWKQSGDYWYCVYNGELCRDDFYTIGGKTYYFDWEGRMYDDEFFWVSIYDEFDYYIGEELYYAKPGGAIAKDEWIQRSGDWYYFKPDGTVYNNQLVKAGNTYYYFYDSGRAAFNDVIETDEGVFLFDENCHGKKITGWFQPDWAEGWMYSDGSILYRGGIYGSGANRYAFDYDGYLVADEIFCDDYTEKYYLTSPVDANGNGGTIITDGGWKKFHGNHVFVTEDGSLHLGWLNNTYYMTPYMTYCDIVEDNGALYAINYKGTWNKITADGFYQVYGDTVYLESGRIVTNIWKKINGGWYYFGEDGSMYYDGSYEVDGARYYFDASGKMYNGGWLRTPGGSWIYAYSNGVLHTGLDGAGYIFDSYGYLCIDEIVRIGDTLCATNADGKSIKTFREGWNQLGSDWYYLNDGDLEHGYFIDANGDIYYFSNETGKMIKNRRYNDYYLGANGKAQGGWIYDNGKWYYGDPKDKELCWDGIYTINGKAYYFESFVLQQNETILYDQYVITTDSEGVVVNKVLANGWTYDVYEGTGYAHYYKNGKPYDGWVGDYYIADGMMVVDSIAEWNDAKYYLGKDGKYLRSGWYERWSDSWIYAKSNGALAYNEWVKIGNYWYYFDGCYMVSGSNVYIDDATHNFAENGVWLGEVKEATYSDGWQKIGGYWYFYMAGYKVANREIYDNGAYYYLGSDGKMITNQYRDNYSGAAYYYGANGARAKYTGWQKVNGAWVFFNQDYSISGGWIYSGGKYYFQFGYIDGIDENAGYGGAGSYEIKVGYKTGYAAIGDKLYQFDNGGVYLRTVTATGWYYADSAWYYVENGQLVCDEHRYKIGNAYYAFNYDGQMVESSSYAGSYYGADGKMITAAGWHAVNGEWIYIDQYGYAAYEGVFLIGGKEYYFSEGVLVK